MRYSGLALSLQNFGIDVKRNRITIIDICNAVVEALSNSLLSKTLQIVVNVNGQKLSLIQSSIETKYCSDHNVMSLYSGFGMVNNVSH